MTDEFQEKVKIALRNGQLGRSRHLDAWAIDIRHFLYRTNLFFKVRIKKTGEPLYALLVTCSLKDSGTPLSFVMNMLEQVWNDSISYGTHSDVHAFKEASDRLQMSVMTVAENTVLTAHIEVARSIGGTQKS